MGLYASRLKLFRVRKRAGVGKIFQQAIRKNGTVPMPLNNYGFSQKKIWVGY